MYVLVCTLSWTGISTWTCVFLLLCSLLLAKGVEEGRRSCAAGYWSWVKTWNASALEERQPVLMWSSLYPKTAKRTQNKQGKKYKNQKEQTWRRLLRDPALCSKDRQGLGSQGALPISGPCLSSSQWEMCRYCTLRRERVPKSSWVFALLQSSFEHVCLGGLHPAHVKTIYFCQRILKLGRTRLKPKQ